MSRLLPPPIPRWPGVLRTGREAHAPEAVRAALARIRAEALWWPAPKAGARRPRALALDAAGLSAARAGFPDSEIAHERDSARIALDRLEAVFGSGESGPGLWARIGGIRAGRGPEAETLIAAAAGVSPWGGGSLDLAAAVEAQALLRRAALRAAGPVRLGRMSRWKRRGVAPFLTGPDGPPRRAPGPGPRAVWGADAPAPDGALRIEDGFLRSVGLGLRHAPPVSLAIHAGPPHFDATRPNAFEACVAAADFTPALLARAARLRARIRALGLSKYNVAGAAALPDPGGRAAILVPGQVEGDASIRYGARAVTTNLALLRAARARWPEAYLLYKPHPDVLTGLRPGAVPEAEARALADHVETRAAIPACLDWAGRVATITSLTGFEALLRGKAATTLGRPFYAGWGLTDDLDPPPRPLALSLDELTAAALILYPSYIDPATRLPAPPEVAVEALAAEMAAAGRPAMRARKAWRDALSWALARL